VESVSETALMVPSDHPLARQQSVSLLELAREPFVFFDPHVGTGLYDDILGLMRRYFPTPHRVH
jgi:DNA-binding transcriptional LysR family regulator